MRLALEPGQQAFGDARLADAGLAREQHDPALAALGLIPTAQQQLDLLLPADERGQRARAPRLEPADAGRLAAHLPRLHGLRQPVRPMAPSARQSNIRPTSRRVLAAITTSPGAAAACSRAARFGVSPIATLLPCVAGPRLLADDDQARWRCRRAPEAARRKRPSACRPRRGWQGRRARPARHHAHRPRGSRNRRARHRSGTGRQIRRSAPPCRRPPCGRRRSDRACPRDRDVPTSGIESTMLQTRIVSCRRSGLPARTAVAAGIVTALTGR